MDSVRAWYSEPRHFLNTDIDSKIFDWALMRHQGYATFLEKKRVLNLGPCGLDEAMLARLVEEWWAVDFAAPLIEHLQGWSYPGRQHVHYEVGDFRQLMFSTETFNTVLDFSSTDHVSDADRAGVRAEIYRVLARSGFYVVTYPNACWINHERETEEFGYERRFTPDEIEAEVKTAGFSITHHDRSGVRSGIIAWKHA